MYHWRITKYNPQLKTSQGNFLANEWTSYSDIGKFYNNKQFTQKDYLDTENAYVNAVIEFMNCLKISSLKVVALEKFDEETIYKDNYFQGMTVLINNIQIGSLINQQQVTDIFRLILREYVWAKLSHGSKMYVHFGYIIICTLVVHYPVKKLLEMLLIKAFLSKNSNHHIIMIPKTSQCYLEK